MFELSTAHLLCGKVYILTLFFSGNEIIQASDAPPDTMYVMATCHSLVQLDDEMVGDPLEKATLNAVEFILTKGKQFIS